jgi:hypothetical protein
LYSSTYKTIRRYRRSSAAFFEGESHVVEEVMDEEGEFNTR